MYKEVKTETLWVAGLGGIHSGIVINLLTRLSTPDRGYHFYALCSTLNV